MSGCFYDTQPGLAAIDNVALMKILDGYRRYVDTEIMTEGVIVIPVADCGGICVSRIDLASESGYQIRNPSNMVEMTMGEKDLVQSPLWPQYFSDGSDDLFG